MNEVEATAEKVEQDVVKTADALGQDVKKDAPSIETKVAAIAEKAELPLEHVWHWLEAEIHAALNRLGTHGTPAALKEDINNAVPPAGAPTVGVLAPLTPKAPE